VQLLGAFGAASGRDGSLGKALQDHEIGQNRCSDGQFQNRVAPGAPKVPYQFSLIVHYRSIECWVLGAERQVKSHVRESISLLADKPPSGTMS
jgi:hypothetical protein